MHRPVNHTLHARKWQSAHSQRMNTVEGQGRDLQQGGQIPTTSIYNNRSHSGVFTLPSKNMQKQQSVTRIQKQHSVTRIMSKQQSRSKINVPTPTKSPPSTITPEDSDESEFALHVRKPKMKKSSLQETSIERGEELSVSLRVRPTNQNTIPNVETDSSSSQQEDRPFGPEEKCFCGNMSAYRYIMFAEPFEGLDTSTQMVQVGYNDNINHTQPINHTHPISVSDISNHLDKQSLQSDLSIKDSRGGSDECSFTLPDDISDANSALETPLNFSPPEDPPQVSFKRTNSLQLSGPNGESIKLNLAKKTSKRNQDSHVKDQCPLDLVDDEELENFISRIMGQAVTS